MKYLRYLTLTLVVSITAAPSHAQAPVKQLFVFGDSLVDNGNLKAITQDPDIPQRFTNGLLSVELLAQRYHLQLNPSLHLVATTDLSEQGNNFAISGARSLDEDGDEATTDTHLPTQVNAFLKRYLGQAPREAVYIISIGGNDIRDSGLNFLPVIHFNSVLRQWLFLQLESKRLLSAVDSEIRQIEKLILAGAKDILVMIPPNLGAIPETKLLMEEAMYKADSRMEYQLATRLPDFFKAFTQLYNKTLTWELKKLGYRYRTKILTYDLFRAMEEQIDAGNKDANIITDEPCIYAFTHDGLVNARCDDFPAASRFLFWDEIHSTQPLHSQMARDMAAILDRERSP